MKCVILACDPGSSNYGYSVLECDLAKGHTPVVMIKRFGCLHNTVRDLKSNHRKQLRAYRDSLKDIVDSYGVTHIIAERYMSRRMGGVTIELVNIMIGAMLQQFLDLSTKVMPASQWKNELKRKGIDLEEVYAEYKDKKITPHAIDASMIGCYGAYILSDLKPYEGEFSPQRVIDGALLHEDIGTRIKKPAKKKARRK